MWRLFGTGVIAFAAAVSALSGFVNAGIQRIQAFSFSWFCVIAVLAAAATTQLASRGGTYSRFSPTVFPVYKVLCSATFGDHAASVP